MPNPAFMHPTSPRQNWTAQSNLVATDNFDEDFIVFGTASAKLVSIGSTSNLFYQTVTAATHNRVSFFVKRPDSQPVTTNDCVPHFDGTDLTSPDIREMGNGWYRMDAYDTGTGSVNAGITVKKNRTVYIDGAMVSTIQPVAPQFFYGDMLGCSWSGTAHESQSVHDYTQLTAPAAELFTPSQGSMRMVLWMRQDYDEIVATLEYELTMLTGGSGNDFRFYYNESDNKLYLKDTTPNTATSAAVTWSWGDTLILHITWGENGLAIYVNGVLNGSNGTYDVDNYTTLRIGSYSDGMKQLGEVWQDFTIWDRELTATQILADYNLIQDLDLSIGSVSPIPFLWTKDGDNIVDNCDDNTRDSWAVVGGIPGSFPAKTELQVDFSNELSQISTLYLSNFIIPFHFDPTEYLYEERQGTVDANSSGGEYISASVGAVQANLPGPASFSNIYQAFEGKEFYVFLRWQDDDADKTISLKPSFTADQVIYEGKWRNFYDMNGTSWHLLRSHAMPLFKKIAPSAKEAATILIHCYVMRSTVPNDFYKHDYTTLMFRPMVEMDVGEGGNNRYKVYYVGGKARVLNSTLAWGEVIPVKGDVIELVPNKLNQLRSIMGDQDTDPVITWTMEYEKVLVTPRWGVM
jgi:hypothetical protein